ncbi:MAG: hypothetical protein HC842_04490 [Cytophagales bacterium]|nr:hypothetical protein [Cytophagales bacterium]
MVRLGAADLQQYEMNLKMYRDYKSTIDTAYDEGKVEGIQQEKMQIAPAMKAAGEPLNKIAIFTGLSQTQLEAL